MAWPTLQISTLPGVFLSPFQSGGFIKNLITNDSSKKCSTISKLETHPTSSWSVGASIERTFIVFYREMPIGLLKPPPLLNIFDHLGLVPFEKKMDAVTAAQ